MEILDFLTVCNLFGKISHRTYRKDLHFCGVSLTVSFFDHPLCVPGRLLYS